MKATDGDIRANICAAVGGVGVAVGTSVDVGLRGKCWGGCRGRYRSGPSSRNRCRRRGGFGCGGWD
jgi:hypothetical protein